MQILVNINQNLANGITPEPLSQEHVNSLVQSFQAHDPRDGAPGTKYLQQLDQPQWRRSKLKDVFRGLLCEYTHRRFSQIYFAPSFTSHHNKHEYTHYHKHDNPTIIHAHTSQQPPIHKTSTTPHLP
jgi:hypothetical protein